jgi:putative oxidoreductase
LVIRRTAGRDGQRSMMSAGKSRREYIVLAITIALGAVFVYAGVDKIRDPLEFADSIAAFSILPLTFINLLALGLPAFEAACGLLVVIPRTRRFGALALALISALFFVALLSALLRGLTLDCGCFGVGAPSRARMWLELGLDAVLFTGGLYVYSRSRESERVTRHRSFDHLA